MNDFSSSRYVETARKEYSYYVLHSRSIPALSDGLKSAARRILWTARNGQKWKSASLAGATMTIHPHAAPESVINTLAAPYGNNVPLLEGFGAFGTRLNPGAFGAARYTSVKLSDFAKDVVFVDSELVELVDSYDGTQQEPVSFLPLVPIALINPSEGIAVGFASNILPRDLKEVVMAQILYLQLSGKSKPFDLESNDVKPFFKPTNSRAELVSDNKWIFEGTIDRTNTTTVTVLNLPYGLSHEKFTNHLVNLVEKGLIVDYEDGSKQEIDIAVKFKRSELAKLTDKKVLDLLNLRATMTENLNVLNIDQSAVWSTDFIQALTAFTDWRLTVYLRRYERLIDLTEKDIQRLKDILTAIKSNLGSKARQVSNKDELKQLITTLGIVNVDYIASLPVYRFIQSERQSIEQELEHKLQLLKKYQELVANESKRRSVYVSELKQVIQKFC